MRRLASSSFLALTLVVPQVHAQDAGVRSREGPIYTFGAPPLTPPRHPSLAPGGRFGPRVPPALIAAAWHARVLAARPTWLAATRAAEMLAAAPPPPFRLPRHPPHRRRSKPPAAAEYSGPTRTWACSSTCALS